MGDAAHEGYVFGVLSFGDGRGRLMVKQIQGYCEAGEGDEGGYEGGGADALQDVKSGIKEKGRMEGFVLNSSIVLLYLLQTLHLLYIYCCTS